MAQTIVWKQSWIRNHLQNLGVIGIILAPLENVLKKKGIIKDEKERASVPW